MFCFPGSLKENKSPASKHAAVTMFPVGSLETCEVPERHRQVNGSSVDKAHQLNASLLLMTAALYLIKTQKSREFQDLVDHVKPTFFFFFLLVECSAKEVGMRRSRRGLHGRIPGCHAPSLCN